MDITSHGRTKGRSSILAKLWLLLFLLGAMALGIHTHLFIPSASNGTTVPGYKAVLYFTNWSIYARHHFPADVPVANVSHLLYAFANVDPNTGRVFLSDVWSDTRVPLGNDPRGKNVLRGSFSQFFRLKQRHRHLKVLLSVGGWTFSRNVARGASTPARRQTFAVSAVRLLKELGLDGLDIDWEYPNNAAEAEQYVDLLRLLRGELDACARQAGVSRAFLLTAAGPAGPEQYQRLKIREMDQFLSFWNLMGYDYAGYWSKTAEFHSNLYGGEMSTDRAVQYYRSQGVDSAKLVVGMPLYGRAFNNTAGLGKPFRGVGRGSWEDRGTYDYKGLPLAGSQERVDGMVVAVSCYDAQKQLLVTYENNRTAARKAEYVSANKLGGGMWWESSGDYAIEDERSIVGAFSRQIGKGGLLDVTENCLWYPESPYVNVRGIKFTVVGGVL